MNDLRLLFKPLEAKKNANFQMGGVSRSIPAQHPVDNLPPWL
jgi:hypothetical protein